MKLLKKTISNVIEIDPYLHIDIYLRENIAID